MQAQKPLWHPRFWPSWLLMGLGWLLAQLPFRLQMWLGARLGLLAYRLVPSRRHVAAVNLAMCFPELSSSQRRQLLKDHFRSVGRGAMETLICWWNSDDKILALSDLEGLKNLDRETLGDRGVILLSAHFTSLELGTRMAQCHLRDQGIVTTAMYKPPHDPVVDYVMRRRREAHIGEGSIRYDRIKEFLRALKRGRAVWYAADQNARNKFRAVLPFFGNPAHTNLATSRLAAMSGAAVVPFFTVRKPDASGYRLIILPPLENFPGSDDHADALRINRLIEDTVRQYPDQYFWLHRRFRRGSKNDPYLVAD